MNVLKLYTKFLLIIFISVLAIKNTDAQNNLEITGYLQNMQFVWAQKHNPNWLLSTTINNRFNLSWYLSENITINGSIRNILEAGQLVETFPDYSEMITKDKGYVDLTWINSSSSSYAFYSNIDRLNLFYTKDNLEIQVGRQRINLGLNAVWTPNDIFNSSSFLNFDYVEKAGSDALRFQYYTGITSSIEFVYKLNSAKEISTAGIFKFNKWEYDFQLLGGIMEKDYVFGGGWAGQIKGAGFTGEFTYFRNRDNFIDTTGVFVAAVGGNYSFPNGLFIQGELLFNSGGKTENAGGINNIFNREYSAKNLSPAKYSLFGAISYPITPLNKLDFSAIFNPSDKSFYAGPSVNISLTENIYLLAAAQFFSGKQETEWGDYGQFYYLRFKWNF